MEVVARNPVKFLAMSTSKEWFQFLTAETTALMNEKLATEGFDLISQEELDAQLMIDPLLSRVVAEIYMHVAKLLGPAVFT